MVKTKSTEAHIQLIHYFNSDLDSKYWKAETFQQSWKHVTFNQ